MQEDADPPFITDLELAERAFFDQTLLATEYVKRYRTGYLETRHTPFLNPHRSYRRLLHNLGAIFDHNANHARSYAKRLKAQSLEWKACESVFAELIVYYSHLALVHEGHVRSLELEGDECDLIVHRSDGTRAFLEVMSIMPDFKQDENGLVDIRTHTQTALSSVRQKLLRKITEQGQLSAERENWAVIELNDPRIAGQFTVLSSLSDGYKVTVNTSTLEIVGEGYDWSRSLFDGPGTDYIKGIVYFDLGNYADRGVLLNPKYIGGMRRANAS
jgi:hypothetical protein